MRRVLENVNCTVTTTYQKDWSRDRVTIEKPGTYGSSTMSHWKTVGIDKIRADFDIEIDVEKIAQFLLRAAQANKTGKASAMGGLIKVKRRNAVVLEQAGNTVPIPAGWTEVDRG